MSFTERVGQKKEKFNEKIQEYPRLASKLKTFMDVWAETFPNPERDIKLKQELRRQQAKMAREQEEKLKNMTPEEIEEMEKSIPEWKRTALVVTEKESQ